MEPGVCRQEGKASEYKDMVKIFFSFLLLGPSFMRSYYVYLHKLPLVKTLLGMTAMFAGTTSSHVLEVSEAHFLVL